MDATLHALGEILLKAVPTFLLVVFLHFYLKRVFFNPLERVLRRRYEATEGALKLAEEILQKAEAKSAEYETAMRTARAEVYQAQEQFHKQIEERETAALGAARASAEDVLRQAVASLDAEAAAARAGLERQSDALAGQIAESLLRRSAA